MAKGTIVVGGHSPITAALATLSLLDGGSWHSQQTSG